VKASIGLTPEITVEPFWLLEFRRNELEPAGTYFSTNDFFPFTREQLVKHDPTIAELLGTLWNHP
jgi:hypothetical protein